MKDIKIKYDSTFGTIHSRDYYKGKSFHYAGQWTPGAHYFSDDYNVDFIVKDNCLLACARSHFSTVDNEPKDFILDSDGVPIGIASRYWDFVLSGRKGITPLIKIEDGAWWVSYNNGDSWRKLADIIVVNWGDETDDSIDLSINGVTKKLSKEMTPISDSEIDSIMEEFNMNTHGRA